MSDSDNMILSQMPDVVKKQIGIELAKFKTSYTPDDSAHEAGFIQGFNACYIYITRRDEIDKTLDALQTISDTLGAIDERWETQEIFYFTKRMDKFIQNERGLRCQKKK